jgi:ribonuclease HI
MPTPARYVAFCDGSALVNPGGPGGTGFVVLDRTGPALRFGGTRWVVDGAHPITNNRMELRAVLEALDGLPAGEQVEVVSDSRYVVDALSKWIAGWRRKGWRTAAGAAVLNRELIEAIDARAAALRVRYAWVRGHDGHAVNEVVDQLAQAAARGSPGPDQAAVEAALRAEGHLGAASPATLPALAPTEATPAAPPAPRGIQSTFSFK